MVGWCVALAASAASPTAPTADGLIGSPEPDWPQWRGRNRDGICDEKGLLTRWPEGGPKLLWSVSGLGRGWSSPIICRGSLYITGDVDSGLVVGAYGLDGKPRWQTNNGRAWKRSWPGARASCAYAGGRLYHMNANGRAACLEANSGREIWAVNTLQRFAAQVPRWGISECLLVDGRRVIVTPGGRKGLCAALDAETGDTVWASKPVAGERAGYASPILFRHGGRRHIVGQSSRHAYGVDAETGKLLWTHPRPTRYDVLGCVPVYDKGTVFVTSPDDKIGELLRLKSAAGGVAVEPIWSTPVNNLTGGAVLVGGRLFSSGYRHNDHWFCVDFATGKTLYEKKDLNSGSAVWADGRLYCLSERGEMALLRPTETGFETAGRFRLIERKRRDVWAHPVIHKGRLYLRYHDTLRCYDVRGAEGR